MPTDPVTELIHRWRFQARTVGIVDEFTPGLFRVETPDVGIWLRAAPATERVVRLWTTVQTFPHLTADHGPSGLFARTRTEILGVVADVLDRTGTPGAKVTYKPPAIQLSESVGVSELDADHFDASVRRFADLAHLCAEMAQRRVTAPVCLRLAQAADQHAAHTMRIP